MTTTTRNVCLVKTAGFAALFAWIMLIGQSLAHAEHIAHDHMSSNQCAICIVGGPEDDIALSPCPIGVASPSVELGFSGLENLSVFAGNVSHSHTARAPPYL